MTDASTTIPTYTDAPSFIAADTYTGRWTATARNGLRPQPWKAAELAEFASTGVIWVSFGHVNGREHFSRTRYLADADGNLHCYAGDGHRVIIHPAGRTLRILVK